MIYKYKAIKLDGDIIEGFYESKTKSEVVLNLKNQNYLPIYIEKYKEKHSKIKFFKVKTKKKDLAIFCRQFFIMINSGINILNSIDLLSIQTGDKSLKKSLKLIYLDLQKGITLSAAMKKHVKIFPLILIHMIEAGEISGNLEKILDRMAINFEKEDKLENKIRSALIYPIILILVSIGVVIFMLVGVLPTFIGIFETSGSDLPGVTLLLLKFSNFLQSYWKSIFFGISLSFILFIYYKNSIRGKKIIDYFKIELLFIKKLNQKIITSRFTRTLSILISSGIPLINSLEITGNVINNSIVKLRLDYSIDNIKKGIPLSKAIKHTKVFPPMVYAMINIGEESGSLDKILIKTAEFYDNEVEVSLHKMVTLIEPVLLIIISIIIGFIIISIAIPMFDLVNII